MDIAIGRLDRFSPSGDFMNSANEAGKSNDDNIGDEMSAASERKQAMTAFEGTAYAKPYRYSTTPAALLSRYKKATAATIIMTMAAKAEKQNIRDLLLIVISLQSPRFQPLHQVEEQLPDSKHVQACHL